MTVIEVSGVSKPMPVRELHLAGTLEESERRVVPRPPERSESGRESVATLRGLLQPPRPQHGQEGSAGGPWAVWSKRERQFESEGYIVVKSPPGAGTTITIYLPHLDTPAGTAPSDEAAAASPRGDETILLVEDDDEVRDLAREILENSGYVVRVASHPLEALSVAKAHSEPLHLLLADVVMPTMSGRQMAERLIRIHPEAKVLYVSGFSAEVLGRQGVLGPGPVLLSKPFTADGLARKVREVLDDLPRERPSDAKVGS